MGGLEVDGEPGDVQFATLASDGAEDQVIKGEPVPVLTLGNSTCLAHSDTLTCQICQHASGGGIGRQGGPVMMTGVGK